MVLECMNFVCFLLESGGNRASMDLYLFRLTLVMSMFMILGVTAHVVYSSSGRQELLATLSGCIILLKINLEGKS